MPEPDGMLVRIYDGNSKLSDQEISCYRCSRCDDLYQNRDNGMYKKAFLHIFNKYSFRTTEMLKFSDSFLNFVRCKLNIEFFSIIIEQKITK